MKRLFYAAAALAVFVSCGQKVSDPVQEAIVKEITENLQEGFTTVKIYNCELVDSTSFRQEFEHRKKAFEARKSSDEQFLLKYSREGKRQNAAIKQESYIKTISILQGLDSLETAMSSILDETAYYDYRFSGMAKGPDSSMEFKDTYVTITPDGRVMSMTSNPKDLHKSLGRVIPGYLDLIDGEAEESEE
ncbi:MAG: hypothetical protein Q4G10_08425 [Bacteroidia bacterium]|nr:hypothetical protein [Bacteroidia bacterium]